MKKSALLLALLMLFQLGAGEKPLLRAGVMTDTHVTPDPQSANLLRAALELFKSREVDLVINLGDVADKHFPKAYQHSRNTVKAVYPNGIKEIFAFANHDLLPVKKNRKRHSFDEVKAALEITHEPLDLVEVKGFPFVIFPQDIVQVDQYEKHLAAAAAKYPGKPLFIVDHTPERHTVFTTNFNGSNEDGNVIKKFPQAIKLCGHTHNDIRNELCFWQGEYNVVNAGCLQTWRGKLKGTVPTSKVSCGVLIMDVFKDRIVIHRMDCLSGKKVAEPWIIPQPHNPKNPPFSFEKRLAASTAPEFPAESKLEAAADSKDFFEVKLNFNAALPQKSVYKYEITIKDKATGKAINQQEIFGDFFHERPVKSCNCSINAGYFDTGKEYILEVAPLNFFGKRGKPLQTLFKAPPQKKWTTVFESRDPMKELKFKSGLAAGKVMPRKGDFYFHEKGNARLIFPAGVWKGKKGTRFRFTIDMHTIQSSGNWTLVLRNPEPLRNANNRIDSHGGDSGLCRYVIDFTKKRDSFDYYFLIREGASGLVKFNYVKIERMD